MNKQIYISLLLLLGFALTPTLTYACGQKSDSTEKSCCKKGQAETAPKKECCQKETTSSDQNDEPCKGKCGNNYCHCPSLLVFPLATASQTNPSILFVQRQQFYELTTYLSSDFHFLWSPPKIG